MSPSVREHPAEADGSVPHRPPPAVGQVAMTVREWTNRDAELYEALEEARQARDAKLIQECHRAWQAHFRLLPSAGVRRVG